MKSKKKLLKESRLYVIIDKGTLKKRKSIFGAVSKIKNLGVDIVQLRNKESNKETILRDAYALHKLLLNTKTIFIVNDYIDVAKIVDCDGIHLGQDDTPVEIARQILGDDKIIGVSCHNIKEALKAQTKGADYISIGPVFKTALKPKSNTLGLNTIREIIKKIRMPLFVIGGIDEDNISKVLSTGAKRVAVCRAVCRAKDIKLSLKNLKEQLHS